MSDDYVRLIPADPYRQPLPPAAPKHEDELIIPAREGALRVLRASRDAGVRRAARAQLELGWVHGV